MHCTLGTLFHWLLLYHLTCSTKESERRLDLIMENGEIADMLQQVGHLLQRERNLSEQMRGEPSWNRQDAVYIDLKWPQTSWFYSTFAVFRCQYDDLQERKTCISNKERLLAAKIMEVKVTLAEVKNANAAGKGRNWMSKAVLKHSSLILSLRANSTSSDPSTK